MVSRVILGSCKRGNQTLQKVRPQSRFVVLGVQRICRASTMGNSYPAFLYATITSSPILLYHSVPFSSLVCHSFSCLQLPYKSRVFTLALYNADQNRSKHRYHVLNDFPYCDLLQCLPAHHIAVMFFYYIVPTLFVIQCFHFPPSCHCLL